MGEKVGSSSSSRVVASRKIGSAAGVVAHREITSKTRITLVAELTSREPQEFLVTCLGTWPLNKCACHGTRHMREGWEHSLLGRPWPRPWMSPTQTPGRMPIFSSINI